MATPLYNNRSHDGLSECAPQFTDTCCDFQTTDGETKSVVIPNDPSIRVAIFSFSAETWVSVNNDVGAPNTTVTFRTQQRMPATREVSVGSTLYFYTPKAASCWVGFYS